MAVENTHSKDFDGCWLRRATDYENFFEGVTHEGQAVICYKMRLESKSPLKEEQVKHALTHLYRKCPALHFCFGHKDGERWIRRPTNPEVDFKVLKGKRLDETGMELFAYRFNSETGPLFCARLLLDATDAAKFRNDLDPSLPHSSYIVFGIHHSIGDGTSNAHIMGYFISLLNDVISEKPICDDEALGQLIGDEYTKEVFEEHRELLRADPQLNFQIAQEIDSFEGTESCVATHFVEHNAMKETRTLDYTFDQATTNRFFQKCRDEGITINSGLAAAGNVALSDLLLEKGIACESYRLKLFFFINLRRYWKVKLPEPLGIHSGYPLQITSDTPKNLDNNYWEYARSLHKSIWNSLKSKKSIFHEAHITLPSKSLPVSSLVGKEVPVCSDIAYSNIGDITSFAFRGEDQVRITHIFRSAAMHDFTKGFLFIYCHTFRGKFTLSFAYNASAIGRGFVEKLCQQIVKHVKI